MTNEKSKDDSAFVPKGFGFYIRPYIPKDSRKDGTLGNKDASIFKKRTFREVIEALAGISYEFQEIMLSLLRYTKQVGDVARNTQNKRRIELYNAIRDVVDKAKKKGRKNPEYELVVFLKSQSSDKLFKKKYPICSIDQARTIRELSDANDIAPTILCETALQQIVNRWETHLSNIVRVKYSSNPEFLTTPISLTLDQILSFNEISSIKRLFVDQAVSQAMDGGIDDHLKYFKTHDELGVDFQECFQPLNRLKEVMFHRDVVVHCDGIASERHRKKMRGICKPEDLPALGSKIKTDLRYVLEAWDVVYAAGCTLAYCIAVKYAKDMKNEEIMSVPNGFLLEASFYALKEERYDAAKMILESALGNDMETTGEEKLALKINLALAYKHLGFVKKFSNIINDKDWESRNEQYKAVIAVLRRDFTKAYALIRRICKDDPSYLNCVYDWVVYEDLRADPSFKNQMAKIRATKSFVTHNGTYPVLEFDARPSNVEKHLDALFNSLLDNKADKVHRDAGQEKSH